MVCVTTAIISLNAQTKVPVYYKYDVNGNRSSRSITLSNLKSAEVPDSVNNTDSVNANYKAVQKEKFLDEIGAFKVNIYPNPTKGKLLIEITGGNGNSPNYSLEIYALSGQKLQIVKGSGYSGELNLSSYKSGMYIMNINIDNKKSQWHIVKE